MSEYESPMEYFDDAEKNQVSMEIHSEAGRKSHDDFDEVTLPYIGKISGNTVLVNEIMNNPYPAEELYRLASGAESSTGLNDVFDDDMGY